VDPIRTTAELYAHALAMEEEAAHRYVDFALRMLAGKDRELADLFWALGRAEGAHYAELLRLADAQEIVPPRLAGRPHAWMEAAEENTELALRLMTPRKALALALVAEGRARDFFERIARTSPDAAVRILAREMAAEEDEHLTLLLRAMDRALVPPAAPSAWDRLFVEKAA
jgi:rubrerythrin